MRNRKKGGVEWMEEEERCREDGGRMEVLRGWRKKGGVERMEEEGRCREDGGRREV